MNKVVIIVGIIVFLVVVAIAIAVGIMLKKRQDQKKKEEEEKYQSIIRDLKTVGDSVQNQYIESFKLLDQIRSQGDQHLDDLCNMVPGKPGEEDLFNLIERSEGAIKQLMDIIDRYQEKLLKAEKQLRPKDLSEFQDLLGKLRGDEKTARERARDNTCIYDDVSAYRNDAGKCACTKSYDDLTKKFDQVFKKVSEYDTTATQAYKDIFSPPECKLQKSGSEIKQLVITVMDPALKSIQGVIDNLGLTLDYMKKQQTLPAEKQTEVANKLKQLTDSYRKLNAYMLVSSSAVEGGNFIYDENQQICVKT